MRHRTSAATSSIGIPPKRSGFTLMETGLATIVIGLGVTSVLALFAKGTISNINGADLTTAVNLANNIHELTYGLKYADPTNPGNWGPEGGETLATYNDLDDFAGSTFSPPIDARRQSLSNYTGWSQVLTLDKVDVNRIATTVPSSTVSPTMRFTVDVKRYGQTVYTESWLLSQGQ